MNFRTVGELRGGRGDHPSEEVIATVQESGGMPTPPSIDDPEHQSPILAGGSLPKADR
jgi:hypothetical protein